MTRNNFTLGFEIEGVYRNICCDGGYGSQNAEPIDKFWSASEDSSIESTLIDKEEVWCEDCDAYDCGCYESEGYCSDWEPVEVVSDILNTSNYKEALKSFQNLAQRGTNELSQDVEFNNSTGCHIHFKVLDDIKMKDLMSVEMVDKFHAIFKKHLLKAVIKGLIPEDIAKTIMSRYYRGYSAHNKGSRGGRYSLHWSEEFGTLEWRSFNLTDIKTWKQFHTMFNIGVKTIDEAIDRRFAVKKSFAFRRE